MLREILISDKFGPHAALSVSGQKGLNNKTDINQ
jgi:hypothetical protein